MVFCEICLAENCVWDEHIKKLKTVCRLCHTQLIKKHTVLLESLVKHTRFRCKYKNDQTGKYQIKNILRLKNVLPVSPDRFPSSVCYTCCLKVSASMNTIIPKLKKVSKSNIDGVKLIVDKYWPFPADSDEYFKEHPTSVVPENESETSILNNSAEIYSQIQPSSINPDDNACPKETHVETDEIVSTPAMSKHSSTSDENVGFSTPKKSKRYISGITVLTSFFFIYYLCFNSVYFSEQVLVSLLPQEKDFFLNLGKVLCYLEEEKDVQRNKNYCHIQLLGNKCC